jgi:hypothetical protein
MRGVGRPAGKFINRMNRMAVPDTLENPAIGTMPARRPQPAAPEKEIKMNKPTNVHKAEYLLKAMLFDTEKAAQLSAYAWASESSRWNELVTILASQGCDLPDEDLRELTKYLSDLGHLDIQRLAGIRLVGDQVDPSDEEARKIVQVFKRKKVPEKQALQILLQLCQMAASLVSNFGGKIQIYLRSSGEAMLKQAPKLFPLQGISSAATRRIFARWFQKVMNMPVLLQDAAVSNFCKKNDISVAELVEAADNINLNLAIVDELLALEAVN